mgnify:CR=1 FL=1
MGWLELVQVQCSFFSVSFSWSINYFLSPLGLRLVTANLEAAINKTAKSFADLIQFFFGSNNNLCQNTKLQCKSRELKGNLNSGLYLYKLIDRSSKRP